jgi:L-alanine-DL-glutamate epimerase-like enolase superfamily enzyme
MKLSAHVESWPTARPFRIAGREWLTFDSVVVELEQDGIVGRGEGLGVFYLGDHVPDMLAAIEEVAPSIEAGIDRLGLEALLPPGGARNVLDLALWDLEAKTTGRSIWSLTGITPKPLQTVYTISLDPQPADMAAHAASAASHGLLKVKLGADRPLERIEAIRRARPDVRLVVDANQAWSFEQLQAVAPGFAELGVEMIEQPLARGADACLSDYRSPVPLGADESCLHLGELDAVASRYQMINIKLDKTGGLTHALKLALAARERGLGLMVGCMGGSSLSIAPAFVLGCLVDLVDIDGPLLLRRDRLPGIRYERGWVTPPPASVWG